MEERSLNLGISVISNPGWVTIGKIDYNGLVWRIIIPAPAEKSFNPIPLSSIEVEIPPRCPNCETEIEELSNHSGRVVWRCVRCGFKKRNRDGYFTEKHRAEKIARRELEDEIFAKSLAAYKRYRYI